jgi:hypothetical protein
VGEEEQKLEEEKKEEGHQVCRAQGGGAEAGGGEEGGGVSSVSCSGGMGALGYASSVFLVAGALTSSSFDQAAMNGGWAPPSESKGLRE